MVANVDPISSDLPRRICYLETQDRAFLSHRIHLGKAALSLGLEVHVIAPPGDASGELRNAGFHCHPLPMKRSGINPWSELGAVRELARLYRRIRPDLVHHVALKSVLYGSVVARSLDLPAVGSITGLGYVFIGGGVRRTALRHAVTSMLGVALDSPRVHIIFQNPDDRALFVEKRMVRDARTSLIPGSGVDTDIFTPLPEPASVPRVLVATRMLRDKGILELVAAARQLRGQGVAFELLLVGDADPENPASIDSAQLRSWNDEGIVRWLGKSNEIARLLQEAHVACLPSYREGLPLFLAEAAAAGRPAVTTDVPGCRSVVQAGRTGLLVPPRDAPALAIALKTLLCDQGLRVWMGQAARQLALEQFAKERVVEATLRIYATLLGERRTVS
jgi:glycosyltransferase involved in cell wall biosynthesis